MIGQTSNRGDRENQDNIHKWIASALNIYQPSIPLQEKINKLGESLRIIIENESSGDPNAVNNWDSNAQAGHPSKGLMQLIDSTFAEFAMPCYNTNILDPVSNILAGIRYANFRYGDINNVPGVVAVKAGRRYIGY